MNEDYKGLNLVDLLDLLEPIPEPAAISLVPQTQGWIWLGLAGLVLVFKLSQYGLRVWRRNAYRRAALREVNSVKGDPVALAIILRRTALAAYPRTRVASLFGSDWLAFLDRAYGGIEFSSGDGQALAVNPYQGGKPPARLDRLVSRWIKTHKVETEEAA